jgi:Zn-dependent protease
LNARKGARRLIFLHSELIGENNLLFFTLVASTLFALLIGVGFHEFCHAFIADRLGDRTPASQGRVTLNPLAHLDPFGTLMMLFVGFGWGKPVQFNPYGLRTSPKVATLLVAGAGPASNFVAAFLLALPIQFDLVPYINPFTTNIRGVESADEYIGLFLTAAVYLSIILGIFNLIPLEPLDGFKVALGVLPDPIAEQFARLRQFGIGPFLMLLFGIPFITGYFGTAYYPLADIMFPTARWVLELFTGIG